MGSQTQFAKLRGNADPHSARVQDNIDAVLRPVVTALAVTPIMGAPPPAWINLQPMGGMVLVGPPYAALAFHIDALGYVHAKGVLINHSGGLLGAGTVLAQLPMGARPKERQRFAVDGPAAFQAITVNFDGLCWNEVAIANNATCDFAFTFLAEQ